MAIHYDLLIIGAGPGGYTAALKAAGFGLKTAVIEKEKLGGVCLNRGCIPTKALLHSSSIFSMLQQSDEFGVSADFVSFDFKKMQDYKKRSVKAYRNEIRDLFESNQIDLIQGTAKIRRGKTVVVRHGGGKEFYEADHIIIATGSRPVIPDIPGIGCAGVVSSERLLAAESWNYDRLTIIGGGVIGVEFATIFNSLCSKVTIIEQGSHLLGPMDLEVARQLEKELSAKGITICCNARVKEIREQDGLTCFIEQEGKEFSVRSGQVLTAVGRVPNMDGLFGDDVEFAINDGRLVVDSEFMTSEPDIYAVGDVAAQTQLAHVAAAQGTYVVEQIAGREHSVKLSVVPNGMYVTLPIVPNCIYTDPEIATVGITEEAARKCKMKVRCGRYEMNGNGKSIISREKTGFIRLIFEAYSNSIVGAQIVCPRATDMISEMATAIANGLTASQLSLAMRAHPTYSEGISAAIEDAMKDGKKGEKRHEDSGI